MKPHKNNSEIAQLLKYKPYITNRSFWKKDREQVRQENADIAAMECAMNTVYGDQAADGTWKGIYASLVYPVPISATPFAQ